MVGIKILTNTIDPELNSASIVFFGFSSTLFSKKYILNPYNFAGDPARAAAIWGRVASRDATASARATPGIPRMQAPVFGCLFRYERNVLGKNGGQIRNQREKLA